MDMQKINDLPVSAWGKGGGGRGEEKTGRSQHKQLMILNYL